MVAFKTYWTKNAKAASLKRIDQLLDCMPIGVVAFLSTVIQNNQADKARKTGIPAVKFSVSP